MKDRRHRYGKTSDKVTKVAIIALAVAMVVVAGYTALQFHNMPEYATEREINALAKDYYENYFYDKLVENAGDNSISDIMSAYAEKGMEPVKLRQFFVYDNARHQDSEKIFTTAEYPCNTNTSTVRYTPVAPYGKTDYTYEVNLSCKKS